MNNVNHALDVLGQKQALADLRFDAEGVAGLVMSETVTIHLTRIDDEELEISCALPNLGHPDAAMMQAMLETQFLGVGVGASRLGMDAESMAIILCERWVVSDMTAAVLERRFEDFAANAAFWLDEGTALLLEQAETIRQDTEPSGDLGLGLGADGDPDSEDSHVLLRL